jgi:hypothetical protein
MPGTFLEPGIGEQIFRREQIKGMYCQGALSI